MTAYTGEELKELIEISGKKFQEDTQFLLDHGWIRTEEKELEGEKVFEVWTHPITGKKYGHQNCFIGSNKWTAAIDKAEHDLIDAMGFEDFTMSMTYPEFEDFFAF